DAFVDSLLPVTTRYDYDNLNRQIRVFENYLGGVRADRITTRTYDALDDVLTVRTGDSTERQTNIVVTGSGYNAEGWRTLIVEASGRNEARTTTLDYDAAGNIRASLTGQSSMVYDQNWNLVPSSPTPAAVYGKAEFTTFAYDAMNRRIQMTEAADPGNPL